MNESIRRNLLYVVLAITAIAFALDAGVRKFYDEPHAQRESRLRQIESSLGEKRKELARLASAPEKLAALSRQSLPGDLELARSAYQNWLLDLIGQVKLDQPKVDAGTPSRRTQSRQLLYYNIGFSVTGRGTMAQLTNLLHALYSANHLHKIRALSLVPLAGTDQLDISIALETIVLPTADRTERLAEGESGRLVFDTPDAYAVIANRNLFAVGGPGTPASRWIVSAVTSNVAGEREVWLTNSTNGETRRFKKDDLIQLNLFTADVTDITSTHVEIRHNDQLRQIAIGHSLADGQP